MQIKLRIVGGKHDGREIAVRGPKFLIGRGEECDLRPVSELVSRNHCVLHIAQETVTLEDLNSRNGTLVNGVLLRGKCNLTQRDVVKVGVLGFCVVIQVVADSAATTELPTQSAQADTKASAAPASAARDDADVMQWLNDKPSANSRTHVWSPDEPPAKTSDTHKISLEATHPAPAGPKKLPPPADDPAAKPMNSVEAATDFIDQVRRKRKGR